VYVAVCLVVLGMFVDLIYVGVRLLSVVVLCVVVLDLCFDLFGWFGLLVLCVF